MASLGTFVSTVRGVEIQEPKTIVESNDAAELAALKAELAATKRKLTNTEKKLDKATQLPTTEADAELPSLVVE